MSNIIRILEMLNEERSVMKYKNLDTALAAFNKMKTGHSMLVREVDGKKEYGIVWGGKVAGWNYYR